MCKFHFIKLLSLVAVSLLLQAGLCNAKKPDRSPAPIDAKDIAILMGLHKFQVDIPDKMIGGPAFLKVFYVQPDGTEVEIGGCGIEKSEGVFDVLLKESKEGRLKVITRCVAGFSTSNELIDNIGEPQQWFINKIATNGSTLAVFWNKARIVVRIRATVNPIWKKDKQEPAKEEFDSISLK